jgi:signal transduction histidine kinase
MKVLDVDYFKIGPRLTLTFAVLVALILGGNGLLVWQFHIARAQTAHLALVSEQLIAILRFQDSLLSLRQRLDESAKDKDAGRLRAEADQLRAALLEQTRRTRSALAGMPSKARVDQAFLPTLEAIAIALPSQLDAIIALASSGDWEAVRLRLVNELKPMETQTSALVKNIDAEVSDEMSEAEAVMGRIQSRILILVPLTAISTFFIAAFFGWTITRRIIGLRLEARVGERTRIARELHDTLLQSFHGLLFRFQAARNMLPKRPEEAIQALDGAIARAERALAEGRDAVQDLRPDPSVPNDLEHLLTAVGQELSDSEDENGDANLDAVPFRVTVEGEKQTLSPILQDEVYRIARELIRNAFRHARARRIEAEIRYDDRLLRLRIRDDGKGIDPRVLQEGGRVGHWGLPGIRERTQQIGARLDFWSEAGAGTEVELTVPASIAYVKPRNGSGRQGRGFRIFREKPETHEHRS